MSNSNLIDYTLISPNKTSPRNHVIDTITVHCVVGQVTVERLGEIFANPNRKASSNYGIGFDGKIGLYVDEKDRSWCSSDKFNDNRAITIEVASDNFSPYKVNDTAYNALINLLVDICLRNDICCLKWKADKSLIGKPTEQNMTVHRWFANTECPGDFLYSHMGDIAEKVNEKLEEIRMVRYNTVDEIPEYGKATIIKLIKKNILSGEGNEKDKYGYPTSLNLSEDMIRMFIVNDRAGLYD